MVFKRLIFCICSIFGPRGWRRIKAAWWLEVINIAGPKSCNSNSDEEMSEGSRLEENHNNEGFDPNDQDEEEEKMCCVCLSRLNKEEDKRLLPCSHEFHRECVERWLKNSSCRKTCPVCRFLMEDGGEKTVRRELLSEEMLVWFSSFHVTGF